MPSLVKRPVTTPEKLAANRANGRSSHGPATPEGAERCHDSAVRHGFYSKRGGEALRILGEDPEDLERLLRATWRLKRSDRAQDSMAVNQVREMSRELNHRIQKGP